MTDVFELQVVLDTDDEQMESLVGEIERIESNSPTKKKVTRSGDVVDDTPADVAYTLACAGFDADEIVHLLGPIDTFARDIDRFPSLVAEWVTPVANLYDMDPGEVADVLDAVADAATDHPITAEPLFETFDLAGPTALHQGLTPSDVISLACDVSRDGHGMVALQVRAEVTPDD